MLPVDTTMAVMCHMLVVFGMLFHGFHDPDAATAGSPAVSTHVGILVYLESNTHSCL